MYPCIEFTVETGKMKSDNIESLNFLDIEIILKMKSLLVSTFITKRPIRTIT